MSIVDESNPINFSDARNVEAWRVATCEQLSLLWCNKMCTSTDNAAKTWTTDNTAETLIWLFQYLVRPFRVPLTFRFTRSITPRNNYKYYWYIAGWARASIFVTWWFRYTITSGLCGWNWPNDNMSTVITLLDAWFLLAVRRQYIANIVYTSDKMLLMVLNNSAVGCEAWLTGHVWNRECLSNVDLEVTSFSFPCSFANNLSHFLAESDLHK